MKTFTEEQIYEVVADSFNNIIKDIPEQFSESLQNINTNLSCEDDFKQFIPYYATIGTSVDISAKIVKEVLTKLLCE